MMAPPKLGLPLRWAALRFRSSQREAYYDYLADILEATQGRNTIKQILANDAHRYGTGTVRGQLSLHWAHQVEEYGELGMAFTGTLPERELALIRMMQRLGGSAVIGGFRELAVLLRLDLKIKGILLSTLSMAYFAVCVCLAMMFAISAFTVPTLLSSFAQVDPIYQGAATRRLVGFADWLSVWLWPLIGLMAGAITALRWALPRWHGKARSFFDQYVPGFQLYRDTQAIRFLVTLAAILKPRTGLNHSLAEALSMMCEHAPPWLRDHVLRMALRLSDARAGASIFNTGLLDKQTYWYLEDLVDAVGMDAALQKTRLRLEHNATAAVAQRAAVARWALIGCALIFLLGTMLWHYAAIHEMRAALLLAY